jgi:hypothetical protein
MERATAEARAARALEPAPADPAATDVPPPHVPATLEDSGLPIDLLSQLLLKTLYTGEQNGTQLADQLCLPYSMLDHLVQHARVEKLVEVRGSAGVGTAGYRYAITDLGRDRTRQFLDINQYVGPAPVPLAQYTAYMRTVQSARGHVDRDRLARSFTHLVVGQGTLDQLGPAINSGKSVFLYGPPGNGKTVMAEGIARSFGGDIYVPYTIEVGGQIITLYDPVNHRATGPAAAGHALVNVHDHDRRWVRIRRPVVIVGGELTLDMLDLSFNPISRYHEAPLQLKANGGVLVVDDFGRQRVPPRDLLNRWIVPLESRVDHLTLHTGRKFEVVFNVLIVFATNLKPESLADEAFLRRIPYKIYARNPTYDEFERIFELNCRRHGIQFDPVVVEYLHRRYYQPRALPMRGCHPRDLIEQVVDLCRYQNRDVVITRELLDAACRSYFVEEEESLRRGLDAPPIVEPPR